ncbi:MAG: transglycosylase SLT domain-containing protein [Pseudomonadota bacterium]
MASPVDGFSGHVAPTSSHQASAKVGAALKSAADATGVDFGYLYNVAARESSLDPNARAKSSSATGLFQFVEQTWLAAVKTYGAEHGMEAEADAIVRTQSGRYVVSDSARKASILNMRRDPEMASTLAAELALDNKKILEKKLGRPAAPADLYAAHFLGAGGAAKLLGANKDASAAALAPAAAKVNRAVFYDGARAKSVGEVIASFEATIGAAAPSISAPRSANAARAGHQYAISTIDPAAVRAASAMTPGKARSALSATVAPGAFEPGAFEPGTAAPVERHGRDAASRTTAAAELSAATRAFMGADARLAPLAVMALGAADPMVLVKNVLSPRP